MVIDADGLRPFYNCPELFQEILSEFVITPHVGELSQLSGISSELITNDFPGSIDKFMSNFPGFVTVQKMRPGIVHQ